MFQMNIGQAQDSDYSARAGRGPWDFIYHELEIFQMLVSFFPPPASRQSSSRPLIHSLHSTTTERHLQCTPPPLSSSSTPVCLHPCPSPPRTSSTNSLQHLRLPRSTSLVLLHIPSTQLLLHVPKLNLPSTSPHSSYTYRPPETIGMFYRVPGQFRPVLKLPGSYLEKAGLGIQLIYEHWHLAVGSLILLYALI